MLLKETQAMTSRSISECAQGSDQLSGPAHCGLGIQVQAAMVVGQNVCI